MRRHVHVGMGAGAGGTIFEIEELGAIGGDQA